MLGRIRELEAALEEAHERLARLEQRADTAYRYGPVTDRDHTKGVRIALGIDDDGAPVKSPWFQPGDRTGASRYVPFLGEQLGFLTVGGDWSQGSSVPYTHSDDKPNPAKNIDETVHHARDGQRHSVEKGHVKDKADTHHSRFVGDEPGESAGPGGNFPHELQRQLQGMRAGITQNAHNITALHDQTTKIREIVQPFVPGLAALQPFLNGDPGGLQKAADAVVGKLEGYVAKSFQQMLDKLTNGFIGDVMGLVQGFMAGDIGAILNQVEGLAAANGIDVAGALSEARAAVGQAASGAGGGMAGPLDVMASAFAGTPAEAAFGLLNGQMGGALGTAASMAAGLGDLVDGQKNITKGMTKHYRLGGYGGG